MTGLAAFSALLGRFTGQTDLVVGAPVANRTEAGIEGMIGFFVNTLALRADLGGDPPFRALLGRVRESALAAWAHQDLPFERLVEELQPDRDPSRSPLFQVLFSLDPSRGSELAPGLACELLRVDTKTAKFDLSLFLDDGEPGLTARLEYATDLFDPATVMRLGRSFRDLLAGLVDDGAGLTLSALPLLGAGERWQIVGEWNEPGPRQVTATEETEETCLYDLVAAQMARTPEATALVFGGERLTYRELGRPSHPHGPAARRARRRAGGAGGGLPVAHAGAGRHPVRHRPGRRRLRAARSLLSVGTAGLHARRRRPRRPGHRAGPRAAPAGLRRPPAGARRDG